MLRPVLPLTSVVCLAMLCVACGSSDDSNTGSTDGTGGDPVDPVTGDPIDPVTGDPIDPVTGDPVDPASVNGMVPCDPLPSTGYGGDDLCIQAPEPGTGVHMHAGPADYDNPDEVAPWILAPSDENTIYYGLNTSNTERMDFFVQHFRMRPGSHHLIMHQRSEPIANPGFNQPNPYSQIGSGSLPIGGTQRSSMDFPPDGIAPEDEDLFRPLNPQTGMIFEMHFVNATNQAILREAWVNFMVNDKAARLIGAPFLTGGSFRIPPYASQTINYTQVQSNPVPVRVVSIFGHRHANADRFTVWHKRGDVRTLVYEDYDWEEPAELFYNSLAQNPAPDRATATAGGISGELVYEQWDEIEWECEVNNRTEYTLTFSDAVYTGEMCNVFGSLVYNGDAGIPIWFGSPPPVIK